MDSITKMTEESSCANQDMPLTEVVLNFAELQNWSDELNIDSSAQRSTLETTLSADGQNYKLYIETNEEAETVGVYLYTPFVIPADRVAEAARLFNLINRRLRLGRLCCADDGESNAVQFCVTYDFSKSQCSIHQINIMIDFGVWVLRNYGKAITAVAFADLSAGESWDAQLGRAKENKNTEHYFGHTLQ